MKGLGEAAADMPWLAPCASSLLALVREPAAVWEQVRLDPGLVLLLARVVGERSSPNPDLSLSQVLSDPLLLERAAQLLQQGEGYWIDWSLPSHAAWRRSCVQQAILAENIARLTGACPPEAAWTTGLLGAMGHWLERATPPERGAIASWISRGLPSPAQGDPGALTRRLAQRWRLPTWLGSVLSHLTLPVDLAQRLGADPALFRVTQLAVALVRRDRWEEVVPLEANEREVAEHLRISEVDLNRLVQESAATVRALNLDGQVWENPHRQPLLIEVLRLEAERRWRDDAGLVRRLTLEIDLLHQTLQDQVSKEKDRLLAGKMAALAELAAGAGHEINNPLAVISGQAQYVLKQLQAVQDEVQEDPVAVSFLDNLQEKISRALHAVIGQTQRIHHLLTDLMQFARPSAPRRQDMQVGDLVQQTCQSVAGLAQEHGVRLILPSIPEAWRLHVDAGQVRAILAALLRNAIEAAPAEGWAGVRCVANDRGELLLHVEDNGPGPAAATVTHLFDPFFSGRAAGRGRGLGLPTAWRFAQQHGGDVRFDGHHQGVTRFTLILPGLTSAVPAGPKNGLLDGPTIRNGAHAHA